MKKIALTVCFFAIFLSCSKGLKYPSWYLVPPANDAQYIYGVGEGFDPDEAKQAALNDAASRIKTSISAKVEAAYDEDSTGANSSFAQKISSQVEKISFSNYTILKSEPINNGQNFVTMIGVDSQKTQNSYKSQIAQNKTDMQNLANMPGNQLQKRNNLAKAASKAAESEVLIRLLETINPNYSSESDLGFLAQIKAKLQNANQGLSFRVNSNDNDIKNAFENAVSDAGISISEKANIIIDLKEQWIEKQIMSSNMAKLILTVSVLDANGSKISSKTLEVSGNSPSDKYIARKSAINKIQIQLKSQGIMAYLGM